MGGDGVYGLGHEVADGLFGLSQEGLNEVETDGGLVKVGEDYGGEVIFSS